MLTKLLPIVLLLVGTGAGVGAGIFMRPAPAEMATDGGGQPQEETAKKQTADTAKTNNPKAKADDKKSADKEGYGKEDGANDAGGMEYVKLNNQFVVPVVKEQKVTALVVLALSLEVPVGNKDAVYLREPKVRDSILQVLFDHANIGGFDGAFTEAKMLDTLRTALREVAQRDLGQDVVNDVLILEIARQDY